MLDAWCAVLIIAVGAAEKSDPNEGPIAWPTKGIAVTRVSGFSLLTKFLDLTGRWTNAQRLLSERSEPSRTD